MPRPPARLEYACQCGIHEGGKCSVDDHLLGFSYSDFLAGGAMREANVSSLGADVIGNEAERGAEAVWRSPAEAIGTPGRLSGRQ